jgi:hypothetical protein
MSRFERFSIDELHTLATALGNSCFKISDKKEIAVKYGCVNTAMYMAICKADNEKILVEINDELQVKQYGNQS